ncbi:hypothetical protein AK830_g1755 [Neonectria ditissima]|uniref:Uncharacterized protein n=1 Tax=Neonectria ditissima TaxID=78410 RepID=A0A0N8H8K4_9HYPO|nr:hypothetical protein AK830_g1755 [Neonectria ditissima]
MLWCMADYIIVIPEPHLDPSSSAPFILTSELGAGLASPQAGRRVLASSMVREPAAVKIASRDAFT